MSKWKEGDRVRIVARPVAEEDLKSSRYYDHMSGLVGTVQNIYSDTEIAVKIDPEFMTKITAEVQKEATMRMREKFLTNATEEQKKQFTKEEMEFDAHYVQLVQSKDLEKV
jgi:ribosomal protein L21E